MNEAYDRRSGWSEWDVRRALTTLVEAEKIRGNKPLMRAIGKEAERQKKAAAAAVTTTKGKD